MLKKPLHIIYITGLGDHKANGQKRAVKAWKRFGVESQVFQVKWGDREPWQPKFERLLNTIDEQVSHGKDVSLVGVSAGATAAINAFAARKDVVTSTVLLAGKINKPEAIGGSYRSQNPAFITSAHDAQDALASLDQHDRKRILSRYALADPIVPASHSRIPGAKNRFVPSIGHIPTIATQITLGARGHIKFAKKHAKARALQSSPS
jgi:hypothetical protein